MKENIKIGLLALIAGTLIFNTFTKESSEHVKSSPMVAQTASTPAASAIPVDMPGHEGHNHPPANEAPAITGPTTTLRFAESSHNFGTIKQDTKNTHKFKFTNTGSQPLIIENATGSCGCTVPEYPKEPIAPGATGVITVEYSPGKQQGQNTKTVTITANTEPRTTQLTISANVEEVK
jgi:hypothetical protein